MTKVYTKLWEYEITVGLLWDGCGTEVTLAQQTDQLTSRFIDSALSVNMVI